MTQKQNININKELNDGVRKKIKLTSSKVCFYLQTINKFLFLTIFVIVAYFIFNTNDLAIKGFVLRDLSMKFYEVNDFNKELDLEVLKLESSEYVSKKAQEIKMVKVDKIDYIETKKEVAKK